MIYFVQMECPTGFIKIGTATDVTQRMSGLRCASPYPVRLLRVLEGGPKEERGLHARFRHLCERNEWFRPGEDLLAFIAREARRDALGMDFLYAYDAASQKRFMRTRKVLNRTRLRFTEPGGTNQGIQ